MITLHVLDGLHQRVQALSLVVDPGSGGRDDPGTGDDERPGTKDKECENELNWGRNDR